MAMLCLVVAYDGSIRWEKNELNMKQIFENSKFLNNLRTKNLQNMKPVKMFLRTSRQCNSKKIWNFLPAKIQKT